MRIGVCGTGRMGSSIAQRLMAVGHEISVWNRNAAKTKRLTDAGAHLSATPAELAGGCDAVIVMLLNDAACEAVYRGPNGLLSANLDGKLVIDMSTVRPDTMQGLGRSAMAQGAAFVESPVGGSTGPATEGKLFGLVGGDSTHIARAMPILQQLCRRIEHVGVLGSGAIMKLAINLPLLVYWQALGEALAICKPLELSPDRLIDILSDTAGAPTAVKGRGAAIAKVLSGQSQGEAAFGLDAAKKDLATAVQFAATLHTELPVAASALACYAEAEAAGFGGADATAVATRWPQRA
jgi:3-hydroxyisobutyrate dehydrogenase